MSHLLIIGRIKRSERERKKKKKIRERKRVELKSGPANKVMQKYSLPPSLFHHFNLNNIIINYTSGSSKLLDEGERERNRKMERNSEKKVRGRKRSERIKNILLP